MKKLSRFYINVGEFENRLRFLKLVKLPDGRFDVLGDADFSGLGLTGLLEIPIRIRRVTGSFWCVENDLVDLEGAPERVDGNFYCYWNKLVSFKGAPKYVGGDFYCPYIKYLFSTEEEVRKLTNVRGKVEIIA